MSVNPAGVNAAAAAAANSSNAAVEALISAELSALAADAQALQGQVTTGQVVTAQVLPSNGMTDLIQILGNRVAAALPPGLAPGDAFTAQVTGFNGPQILLQVLSSVDPAQLSATPAPPGLPSGVVLPESLEAQPSALELAATRPVLDGVTPSVAPPPAVFVAGSIRPAPVAAAPDPVTLPPPPAQVLAQPLVGLADIEARLAAARAGSVGLNGPPPPASGPAGGLTPPPAAPAPAPPALMRATPNNSAPPAPATTANAPPVPPPPLGRFSFAPPITPSARFSTPVPVPAAGEPESPAAPATANLNTYRDPAALVRALNLPVTPTNIAAARLAITTPQRLPAALATLESALPDADDPRVTTLRTLTAFISRMEPSSPQLAAQISAFVDNVVTGNEPKLAQLLSAQQFAAAEPETPPGAPAQAAAPGAPAAAAPPGAPVPTLPVVALAQVVERSAALSVDLKTQLLNVINAPPAGSEEAGALVPAASSALTAITAVQMNAAQAMNASPQTMAFTLPMWLGNGYAQAHIAIDRDAPEPGNRSLDGDNFHIAFILDTKNLGTVSVDLQTVGRSFSLAVKTESEGTAKLFASSLAKLTTRLETLRYRVNSAEASVAARGAQSAAPAPVTPVDEPEADDGSGSGSEFSARA